MPNTVFILEIGCDYEPPFKRFACSTREKAQALATRLVGDDESRYPARYHYAIVVTLEIDSEM